MEAEKYHCLVVDDEPIARKIIINYIERTPILVLASAQINALGAIDHLKKHNDIDIIFLDINMPDLSGMQLIKIAQPKQPVIFTTAHTEYAVESYDLNAVDYLLKPFSFERFTRAVNKALDFIAANSENPTAINKEKKPVIFVKSGGKTYPVFLDDILYCEARKNYTMVMLKNEQRLMPLIPLSKFELSLSEIGGDFIQAHRSFLISKKHITAVTPNSVVINKVEIPIGTQFKESFFKMIGMKGGNDA